MMSLLEDEVLSVLETLVRVTVMKMVRVMDEPLLSKFKEEDFLNTSEYKALLSAALEMHVKEAAEKICRLFSDTSAVLQQHFTLSQFVSYNLKRKPKQAVKRHNTVSRKKQALAVSPSWSEEEFRDVVQPEYLVPSATTVQQSAGLGEFMGIKKEKQEQRLESTVTGGKLSGNDEENICRSGKVNIPSEKEVSGVTGSNDMRETRCIKAKANYWKRKSKLSCKCCKRTFTKLIHLRAHQALHAAIEKPLHCSQCGKSLRKEHRLNTHQNTFPTGPYNCCQCGKTFIHQRDLYNHVRHHKMKKPLKGKACGAHSVQKHMMTCSLKKRQRCDTCGKSFACPSNLYRHQRIHTGEKPFTCQTCGRSFNQLNTLKSHERIHTGEKPYVCKSCGKGFSQANGLRLHDGRHMGENGFSCVVCGLGSACVTALKSHHRTHMEKASVSCSVCGESISSLTSLQNHQNLHGGSKSYCCGICEKTFRSAGSLKIHERTHTGERPYSCSVCSRTFTQQNSLKSHQLSHTGERPFSCDVCGKGFSSAGNLRRHERIHTGQKPYSCNVCERSFTQLNTLKAHMYVHTGEKQYTCDKCGRSFGYQRNLKSHKCAYNQ